MTKMTKVLSCVVIVSLVAVLLPVQAIAGGRSAVWFPPPKRPVEAPPCDVTPDLDGLEMSVFSDPGNGNEFRVVVFLTDNKVEVGKFTFYVAATGERFDGGGTSTPVLPMPIPCTIKKSGNMSITDTGGQMTTRKRKNSIIFRYSCEKFNLRAVFNGKRDFAVVVLLDKSKKRPKVHWLIDRPGVE